MGHGRILFIDAYDSFSNNIITLLRKELQVSIESIKIDDERFVLNDDAFRNHLHAFDAVVAGPGPGHPSNECDVGLIGKLWTLPQEDILPVFGVCLGIQSLCLAYGAEIRTLREPRHGLVTPVVHVGKGLFEGVGDIEATQYHSLHAVLQDLDDHEPSSHVLWQPSNTCEQIIPLAWDLSDTHSGPILMAVRHYSKPFFAVQYHPESICTNDAGKQIVNNWWSLACEWNQANSRVKRTSDDPVAGETSQNSAFAASHTEVKSASVQLTEHVDVGTLVNFFRDESTSHEPILLESGTRFGKPVNAETGHFSIIGLYDSTSTHVRYSTANRQLIVRNKGRRETSRIDSISQLFQSLDDYTLRHSARNGHEDVPFWGGFVGYVSYEAGLETIDVSPPAVNGSHPDVWFIFVERSIVVDHERNVVHAQTIRPLDSEWLARTMSDLKTVCRSRATDSSGIWKLKSPCSMISTPESSEYCDKVKTCQSHLRAGSSYELCLTDQTLLSCESDPWPLYIRLRQLNPAPFSAYLRFVSNDDEETCGVSLVGSSPERFLSWSRTGTCQFRPIKGTVKKTDGVTRATAEEVLGSAKEQAENLMIVDLIRHDLSGVAGISHVRVPKLMSVEEYETVFQLVSVIEGEMSSSSSGISVLAASLPPGSMTGAPKKRSCELLKAIEAHKPRGLYSGVLGFLDVGGGGDFSVVIRSSFKWDDKGVWQVGAGGAVTALSTPEGEFEEMMTKRSSILPVFSL